MQQTAKKSTGLPGTPIEKGGDEKQTGLTLSTLGQKIIHLRAGTQPGIDASGKSNITYLADQGLVIFTSQIKLGKTRNIKFDGPGGFKFTGKDFSVFGFG